jgi:hypothetical protein
MRVAVSHNKGQPEAIRIVDGATDKLFRSIFSGPLQMNGFQKQWNGPRMTFAVNAGLGVLRMPVTGSIMVTDTEIIIDCALPALLEGLASEGVRNRVQGMIRGLLH